MDNRKAVILAVDDQPAILHTVIAELKEFYEVKAFTSGKASLKFLDTWCADLILLDYDMPEMNGCEVLAQLRADPRTSGVPVIFLTGSESRIAEAEVLAKGASDYIQKPIHASVLLTRVRLQLELKRYQNHLESLVEEKTEHLRRVNEKLKTRENITLNLLAEATDMRDHDTGGHIMRTTEMVRVIVTDLLHYSNRGYTFAQNEADNIINSAKLHDLGKIAVPDRILLKPGDLDEDEWKIIRCHPAHGAELLNKYITQNEEDSFLQTARDIALCHHEKWDGTGYPQGLKGEAIPLSARITALADVYDALTSVRPYKKPFSHKQAVSIIASDSGAHFDPYLVSIFLKREKSFESIVQNSPT